MSETTAPAATTWKHMVNLHKTLFDSLGLDFFQLEIMMEKGGYKLTLVNLLLLASLGQQLPIVKRQVRLYRATILLQMVCYNERQPQLKFNKYLLVSSDATCPISSMKPQISLQKAPHLFPEGKCTRIPAQDLANLVNQVESVPAVQLMPQFPHL